MPKQNRKRKLSAKTEDIEYEIDTPKQKFRPVDEETLAEEEQLSQFLFGGGTNFLKCLEEAEQEAGPSHVAVDSGVGEDDSSESDGANDRKQAWYDDEDDGIEVGQALGAQNRRLPNGGVNSKTNKYSKLLKAKFENVNETPKWALLSSKQDNSESDSDDEILKTCGFIGKASTANLPPSALEFKKVQDLNRETYTEGMINSVEFHPSSSVGLVAGNTGIATLFAVDGKRNNKLHSVAFDRFPIICAKFLQNGNEAILGSRQSHIFSYDLMSAKPTRINLPHGLTQCKNFVVSPNSEYIAVAGKWGEIHLLTGGSKELIRVLKQDSEVTALTFNPQGTLLFGHSDSGEITVWDMNMRRVRHKFTDEGCLQGTTLAISSSNQFIAAGSAQGVVNLYGVEDVLQNKLPKPRKTILNLTTGISNLMFNPSSEILALSSADVKNSIKLFHVASGTVFKNFPSFESKMGHINCLNFTPGSGYIAFGNKKSTVELYRLKHYNNY